MDYYRVEPIIPRPSMLSGRPGTPVIPVRVDEIRTPLQHYSLVGSTDKLDLRPFLIDGPSPFHLPENPHLAEFSALPTIETLFSKAYTAYIKRCDDIIFTYFGCFCKGVEAIQAGRVQQATFAEGHPLYEQGIREQLMIDGAPVAQFCFSCTFE